MYVILPNITLLARTVTKCVKIAQKTALQIMISVDTEGEGREEVKG